MRAWLCLTLLLAAPALAEDEPLVVGDKANVKLETHAKRFVGTEIKGPRFGTITELTVLYVEGSEVRVRGSDDTYGWVPMDALQLRSPTLQMNGLDGADMDGVQFDEKAVQDLMEKLNQQRGE